MENPFVFAWFVVWPVLRHLINHIFNEQTKRKRRVRIRMYT